MNLPRPRLLAASFAAILSVLVVIASSSTTPVIDIDQVSQLEEGTSVSLSGLIAGLSANVGGSEDVIIMDASTGATAKAICMPGHRPLPSRYMSIGDEIWMKASTSGAGSTVVFTTSDDIGITKESEMVLTVEVIASNWALFEGDEFRISGIVIAGSQGGFLLADPDLLHSISLRWVDGDPNVYLGKQVEATSQLKIDTQTMVLYLLATSLEPRLVA